MALVLAVPEQSKTAVTGVPATAAATREWLAQPSPDDPHQSLTQIHRNLYATNRMALDSADRLSLLEMYRAPVEVICQNVNRAIAHGLMPLEENQYEAAELARATTIELGYGYKTIVLDMAGQRASRRNPNNLAYAIHRALWYSTATIAQSALFYGPYPEGIWRETHSLFLYAVDLGLENDAITDTLNTRRKSSSIAHVYKHALLLGLSDPYQMPTAIVVKVHAYLHRWASAVAVMRYVAPPTTRCQFIIDPTEDRTPTPFARFNEIKKLKNCLLLDTRGITRLAHDQWRDLQSGNMPMAPGIGREFFDLDGLAMLEKIVPAWGFGTAREIEREQKREPFELVLGVASANFCLNNDVPFQCISEDVTIAPQGPVNGNGGASLKQSWISVNEHPGGLWLKVDVTRSGDVRIRVGDIVVMRALESPTPWFVGTVRWARVDHTVLNIGIQKISSAASPVAVKPVTTNGVTEPPFEAALLLPAANEERGKTAITPPGCYRLQRNLFIDNGEILLMIRAKRLLERGVGYEWFEYEELSL